MRFLDYLQEEFCKNMGFASHSDAENTIYVDPSKAEIIKASKASPVSKVDGYDLGDIRFIADNRDKKFFIWPASTDIHPNVAAMLIRAGEIKKVPAKYASSWQAPYFLMGIAEVSENAKLKLKVCDNWEWNEGSPFVKVAATTDWGWLKKSYFSDISWIEKFKKEKGWK